MLKVDAPEAALLAPSATEDAPEINLSVSPSRVLTEYSPAEVTFPAVSYKPLASAFNVALISSPFVSAVTDTCDCASILLSSPCAADALSALLYNCPNALLISAAVFSSRAEVSMLSKLAIALPTELETALISPDAVLVDTPADCASTLVWMFAAAALIWSA